MIPTLQLGQFGREQSGATPQPTFSNVSLLIHGDERPWCDVSANTFPVANYMKQATLVSGAVAITATNGSQSLWVPANTAFVFGTGAWMMAAYVYCSSSGARVFDTRLTSGATTGVAMAINATTMVPELWANNVSYGAGTPAANLVLTVDTRTHVAFSYDGAVLRCFVGGALSWTHTVALNITANNRLCICNNNSIAQSISGQRTDEMIIVKGEAVYTSSFTPPTRYTDTGTVLALAPNPTYSNVMLNIHGSSLPNGDTAGIVDVSTAARTVSKLGNVAATTAQFRIGTSSIAFDGTGDYLTVPASADFAFGTGDYCIEAQERATSTTGLRVVMSTYVNSTNGFSWQQNSSVAGDIVLNETGDGAEMTGHGTALTTINTWAHVAFGRWGTLLMEFVEGELVEFVTDSQSITNGVALYIGRLTTISTTRDWTGQQQEIRVCKGEMPYKKSFIVQTAPHADS